MIIKEVDNLSTEELGKLFPISISDPNPAWQNIYKTEEMGLKKILSNKALRIEHFGSTAIPNLKAKPTIDILVEIPDNEKTKDEIIQIMKLHGYHFILRNDCPPPYIMFVKGYSEKGFIGQSFHIHMAEKTHTGLWDRLYFRDYLKMNRDIAREYENLKQQLAKKYKYNREAYTEGKTEFIKKITKYAKQKYSK